MSIEMMDGKTTQSKVLISDFGHEQPEHLFFLQ